MRETRLVGFAKWPVVVALGLVAAVGLRLVTLRTHPATDRPVRPPAPAVRPAAWQKIVWDDAIQFWDGPLVGAILLAGSEAGSEQAVIAGGILTGDLRDRDLRGLTFRDVAMHRLDLRRAELRFVHLSRCDLQDARLDGADLRGATYDRHTRWPAGFDPRAHGARLEE